MGRQTKHRNKKHHRFLVQHVKSRCCHFYPYYKEKRLNKMKVSKSEIQGRSEITGKTAAPKTRETDRWTQSFPADREQKAQDCNDE